MRTLRYGLRMLLKSPGFTAVALITMALGIGANTAIFTIVNAVLLKPLPYADPDRLVLISAALKADHSQLRPYSWARYEYIRDHARSYTGIAAFTPEQFTLTSAAGAEQLSAARASGNFFDVLGVHAERGRTFTPSDDQPGAPLVAVISHALWARQFGSDPQIAGKVMQLDSRDYTIAGVLPESFQFLPAAAKIDVWAPRVFDLNLLAPGQMQAGAGFLTAIGRLRRGTTREQAQAEMETLDAVYRKEKPAVPDSDPSQAVIPFDLRDQIVLNVRPALVVLLGAVGFVLLIACANVAGLLLSRAMERRKEIAVRVALGASRGRVIRQLLAESLLLACLSGFVGVLFGQWATGALSRLASTTFPEVENIHADLGVLAFSIGVTLFSGVLFGLIPALQVSKESIEAVLRSEGNRGTGARDRNLGAGVLIVAQIALSVVLMTGSGLLIRSFALLRHSGAGFDPRNAITLQLNLSPARYAKPAQVLTFYRRVLADLASVPGVSAVAISSALPVNADRFAPTLFEGQPQVPMPQRPVVIVQTISPDYPRALGVPLIRGRAFTAHDEGAPSVAIVNEAAVRRFWLGQNPIGKKVWVGRLPQPVEVVGVLGDVKNVSLSEDTSPEVMLPFPQLPWALINVTVRGKGGTGLTNAARARIGAIDREQSVANVQSMDELLDAASGRPRLTTALVAGFSFCAMLIAVAGIYGVTARSVAQRTREFGVRAALGADSRTILRMVLRRSGMLALTGILLGIGGALPVTRIMTSQLYRVSPADPVSLIGSAVLFGLVALVATWIPARRASRLHPVEALRSE